MSLACHLGNTGHTEKTDPGPFLCWLTLGVVLALGLRWWRLRGEGVVKGERDATPTLPGPEERVGVWPRCEATSWGARGGGVLGRLGSPGSASSSITELSSISGK